jgi:hypothetical protein
MDRTNSNLILSIRGNLSRGQKEIWTVEKAADIVSGNPSIKPLEYDARFYNKRQGSSKNKKDQQRASNTSTLEPYIYYHHNNSSDLKSKNFKTGARL